MRSALFALAVTATFFAAAPAARASVVFVAPTASTPGSMTITAPISFTLTAGVASGDSFTFIFQNFVPAADGSSTATVVAPNVAFTINGSAAVYQSGAIPLFVDNFNTPIGSAGPTDAYIFAGPITNGAAAGNLITLAAGTYSLGAIPNFNALATQIFNGNMFIGNSSAGRISNIVSANIPEPSTWALVLGGASLLGVVARRRRGAKG